MEMMLKKACGCISLRVACLIIGYFGAVGNALGTLTSFVMSSACLYFVLNPESVDEMLPRLPYNGDYPNVPVEVPENGIKILGAVGLAMFIVCFIISAMCFGFYVTLLVGVHQKKVDHVKSWTIFKMVFIALGAIAVVFSALYVNVGFFLLNAFLTVLNVYIWAVVRSYYNHLKNGNDGVYSKMEPPIKIVLP